MLLQLVAEIEESFARFVGAGVPQVGQIRGETADARKSHDLVGRDLREHAVMRDPEDVTAGVLHVAVDLDRGARGEQDRPPEDELFGGNGRLAGERLEFGALEFASTLADEHAARKLRGPLASRYGKFFGEWASHVPPANHVDNSMFGCLPLSVYAYTGDARALNQGLAMAAAQWAKPKPEDKEINGMFNYEKRMELWKGGYTPQTRLWMDDMFMITILQLNAFRQYGNRDYAARASHEMVFYLDKMQRADGLFDHGPGAPFTWARGNGWMAAGTAMLLKSLPVDDPNRERILAGFRKMMAGLLRHQRPDGLWGQLVDDPDIWPETSGSAMFAYAFIEGAAPTSATRASTTTSAAASRATCTARPRSSGAAPRSRSTWGRRSD